MSADANGAPPSSWLPVDLAAILTGEAPDEQPDLLRRADGMSLLYPGRTHGFAAEPEAGKGWLALCATQEALSRGENVIYIDYEDTSANVGRRLLNLGVSPDVILAGFVYIHPEEPVTPQIVAALIRRAPGLVIVDGVTDALAVEGLNLSDNQDIAVFHKRLARPFTAAGARVVIIDHVTKDAETRGRYAIGAQHKLAGIDVNYRLDVIRPFGRGRDGRVKITVTKDRPGHVRQHAAGREVVAMMRLVSTAGGGVTVTLEPPEGAATEFRPTVLMERISAAVHRSPGMSTRAIREAVKGKNGPKDTALALLILESYVEVRTEGPARCHYPLKPFVDERQDGRESPDRAPSTAPPVPPACPNRAPMTVPPCPPCLSIGHGARGSQPRQTTTATAPAPPTASTATTSPSTTRTSSA
jgi:AAA domain